jgi:predicted Zn-dependent peptidase
MREILEMKTTPSKPTFIKEGDNYQRVDTGKGRVIYHAQNAINSLFALTITVDMGVRQEKRMAYAEQLLQKSGNARFGSQELKKEWYKLGTDFRVETHQNQIKIKLTGVDENLETSLSLLLLSLQTPDASQETLDALVNIQMTRRKDAAKEPKALSHALMEFARYGKDSAYLSRLPEEEVRKLTATELLELIRALPQYAHTIEYTGPRSMAELQKTLRETYPIANPLKSPPPYVPRKVRNAEKTKVYLFHKEAAQALAYIEFSDGIYEESDYPLVEFYNDYFSGNMNSIVFQELREARALAYTARARYSHGQRSEDENIMSGFIGTQADKTPEALRVFIDLMDNLPRSDARFKSAKSAILTRYQSTKTAFRSLLYYVRLWERLGVPIDPRPGRAAEVKKITLDELFQFHQEHVANRKKVISVVGDKGKIGLKALQAIGPVEEVDLDTIFVF